MPDSPAGTAELHVALASVARAIAESLEITEVWDLVAAGYRSVLRVPLTTGTRRLGSVMIMARQPNLYSEQHAQALLVVAELVTAVLAHQELAPNLAQEARRTAAADERAALLEQRVHTLADELEALSPHRALGNSRRWRRCSRCSSAATGRW